MPQAANTESPSPKRPYRKGNPLSVAERQQSSLARKKQTHQEVRVFLPSHLKDELRTICEAEGVTQTELIERLVKKEVERSR